MGDLESKATMVEKLLHLWRRHLWPCIEGHRALQRLLALLIGVAAGIGAVKASPAIRAVFTAFGVSPLEPAHGLLTPGAFALVATSVITASCLIVLVAWILDRHTAVPWIRSATAFYRETDGVRSYSRIEIRWGPSPAKLPRPSKLTVTFTVWGGTKSGQGEQTFTTPKGCIRADGDTLLLLCPDSADFKRICGALTAFRRVLVDVKNGRTRVGTCGGLDVADERTAG